MTSTFDFTWQGVAQPHIYRRFAWQAWHLWALGGALGLGLARAVTPVTPRHFCVAGVALGDIHLRFHVAGVGTTSHLPSFCVAGVVHMALGGALGLGLGAAVTPVTPRHFCVAGVALGDIHLDFTWQAWHNRTTTIVLRGRRGTW